MTRRSFIEAIITASVAPMFLPSAITYGRVWMPPKPHIEKLDIEALIKSLYELKRARDKTRCLTIDPLEMWQIHRH